jgi:hypothetical protein
MTEIFENLTQEGYRLEKMTSQAIYSSLKEASAEVKRLKIDLGSINPREVTKSEYFFGVWLNKNYREASQ